MDDPGYGLIVTVIYNVNQLIPMKIRRIAEKLFFRRQFFA
jgi:hypothetical protein